MIKSETSGKRPLPRMNDRCNNLNKHEVCESAENLDALIRKMTTGIDPVSNQSDDEYQRGAPGVMLANSHLAPKTSVTEKRTVRSLKRVSTGHYFLVFDSWS